MRQKFRYYWTLVILLSLVLSSFAYATAGNFCGGTSPCLCGSNCNNRGYEDFNDYNTINGHLVSGCKDGAEYAYEYTHEINVTDLERTTFSEGDEIKIVATSYCDSSGDYVNFIYYNGTAWKTLNTSLCNNAGLNNIEFNHTLDQVVGNHTIRIATFWSEETTIDCAQSAVCGFTCEAVYSDTDDVTFYVQSRETDNPIVNSILPSPGSSYNFLQDYQINISANVSDANELTYVRANVTWENGNKVINMSRDSGIYKGNFTDEIYLGRYNVTILARDTFGNLNNTENTYFILNTTTNITIYSPLENHYYDNSNINLNFEVYDTYDLDSVRYKFNSEDIQKSDFGIGVINNESATKSINDSVYINLSQSFNYTEQLEVRRLQFSLKKTGTINDINFKIRTDNNGPGNVIANGSVKSDKIQNSFSFVTAFLNASTTFQGNETYWISLESSGTDTDYIEWQVNEDGYDRGNSYYNNTNNLTYDFLFRIQHENKFNKSIDISNGRNNLTIYKNNTLGVEQSKIIYFTIDPTSPYISYVNYTKNVELGFNQSFKIDVSDYYSNVESALLEIQSRNYSMDTENSTTFTKGFATNMTGNITFRFYINDSAGNWNISDEYSFIVEDTMPPEFLNLSINPYLPDDIDPNVTINLTLNITDHSNLSSVILQFMDIGVWSSFEMVNNTLYYGNFTPNTTAVWTYRIFANDSFGNYNYSNNYTINVSFDTSWQIIPESFGANSTAIGTEKYIGDLVINNTGDYNLTFNISKSGTPTIEYNDTWPIEVPSGVEHSVKINITAPIIASEYNIIFRIDDLNYSVSKYTDITFVSYEYGPYLLLEFPIFDSIVRQGEHIDIMSLKITNIGNETSYNTTLNISLPYGITTRNDLYADLGNISIGELLYYNISADVASDMSLGDYDVVVFITNNASRSNTLSQSITVQESGSTTIIEGGGSSSSSSTTTTVSQGPIVIARQDDIYTDLKEIRIPRGEEYITSFIIKNNESYKTYNNIKLEIEDLFDKYYSLSPFTIKEMKKDSSYKIKAVFNIPIYIPEGKQNLRLKISSGDTIIYKDLIVIVYDPLSELGLCLNYTQEFFTRLNDSGINIEDFYQSYLNAYKDFEEENYENVRVYCENVDEVKEKYYSILESLESMSEQIIRMKGQGYDTAEIMSYYAFVNSTLYSGNFDKAEEYVSQARLYIESASEINKPFKLRLKEFYELNHAFILSSLILLPIFIFISTRLMYITKKENRINSLEKEKQKIHSMLEEMQHNYYRGHLITKDLFKTYVDDYKKRLGEIEITLVKLKNKSFSSKHNLSEQRKQITEMIKKNQEAYYTKKVIDYEAYQQIEEFYNKELSEIEEKILSQDKNIANTNLTGTDEKKPEVKITKKAQKVDSEKEFILPDGHRLNSIESLYSYLPGIRDSYFKHHINEEKNDFATWVREVFGEEELAHKIEKSKTKQEILKHLREYVQNE